MAKLSTPTQRDAFIAFLQSQPLPLAVDCKPWKQTRSSEQNAYLFGVVYPPIADAMGYEHVRNAFRLGGSRGAENAAQSGGSSKFPAQDNDEG